MRTVLIDTKQLKKYESDPEMTIDLQVCIIFQDLWNYSIVVVEVLLVIVAAEILAVK